MRNTKVKNIGITLITSLLMSCVGNNSSNTPSGMEPEMMTGAMDCSTATELDVMAYRDGGRIEAGRCYLVNRELRVDGGVLILEEGVTLQFNAGIGFVIIENGRLTVDGTEEAPVILTGQETSAGFWKGVSIASSGAENLLDYVVIEYAGSQGWNGADYSTASLFADRSSGASVTNCEITDGAGHGFVARELSELMMSGCVIRAHAQGAYVHPNVAGNISADNEFIDNVVNVVRVGISGEITQAETWQNLGIPWRVETGLNVQAPLTITPGTIVEFGEDVGVVIQGEGRLSALGSSEAPITFTGVEKTRGYWQGFEVQTRGSDNQLEHVVIEYSGSRDWTGTTGNAAALRFELGSNMSISNTLFRESANYALWSDEDVVFPTFENNTFEDNAKVAFLRPNIVRQLTPNNTFTGNDENVVRISAGGNFLTQSSTWRALSVPYVVVDSVVVDDSLTIEEGTRIEFFEDAWISVRDEGSLTALGTEEAPIMFTALAGEEFAGYWKGIEIATLSTSNQLDYVMIQYAGSSSWYGGDDTSGALLLGDGAVEIRNSTISDITGWGIDLRNDGMVRSCEGTTFTNLTSDNVKDNPAGVCM